MIGRVLLLAALAASSIACRGERSRGAEDVAGLAVRPLETPGAPGSSEPNVVALADGRALLSWTEPAGEGRHALRFATRTPGGGWSEPATIAAGENWFVNWADFPSVAALPDGTLFAHWLEKRAAGTYEYDVRLTRSTDGGRTWAPALTVHDDRVAAEHGFVAMVPDGESMAIVWLDGRATVAAAPAAAEHGSGHGAGGAMTLRSALFDRAGEKRAERLVDDRVCDCCQTALVRTDRGLVVAYRDRSPDEVRDVLVRRLPAGAAAWSEPQAVGAEGWRIAGCPVNGPALAAQGDQVALAWFTMAGEKPSVKVAFSADAGATWSTPIVVDEGRPMGRVDVTLLEGGEALVAWVEIGAGSTASLRARRVATSGRSAPSLLVADTTGARSSGFPRLDRQGSDVVVAWRDASEPGRIRTALLGETGARTR